MPSDRSEISLMVVFLLKNKLFLLLVVDVRLGGGTSLAVKGLIGQCASCRIYKIRWKKHQKVWCEQVKPFSFVLKALCVALTQFFEELKSFWRAFFLLSFWLTVGKDFSPPSVCLRLNAWKNTACLYTFFLILNLQKITVFESMTAGRACNLSTLQALCGFEAKKQCLC